LLFIQEEKALPFAKGCYSVLPTTHLFKNSRMQIATEV